MLHFRGVFLCLRVQLFDQCLFFHPGTNANAVKIKKKNHLLNAGHCRTEACVSSSHNANNQKNIIALEILIRL